MKAGGNQNEEVDHAPTREPWYRRLCAWLKKHLFSYGLLDNRGMFDQMQEKRVELWSADVLPNRGRVSPTQIALPPPPAPSLLPEAMGRQMMERMTRDRERYFNEAAQRAEVTRREVRNSNGELVAVAVRGQEEITFDPRYSLGYTSFVTSFMTRAQEPVLPAGSSVPARLQFGEAPLLFGHGSVFGHPKTQLPLSGWPSDKVRIKFRPDDFVRAYVKMPSGIRVYSVVEWEGKWIPGVELERNERIEVEVVKKKVRKLAK